VASGADGSLRGFSITIDSVALDPARKGTWFHVTVENSGPDEAEWSPAPAVSTGSEIAYGDYSKSTPLPGDVEPGQKLTGWLFVALDPDLMHRGEAVRLRFAGVAVNGYSAVGDVLIDVNVDPLLA